ncbi:MAG: FHA domain-containing protein [Pseudomonadota bacterium]
MQGPVVPVRELRAAMRASADVFVWIRAAADSAPWPQLGDSLTVLEDWADAVAQLSPELLIAIAAATLLPFIALLGLALPHRRGPERASLSRFVLTERRTPEPQSSFPVSDETWLTVRAGDEPLNNASTPVRRACVSRGAVRIGSGDDCDLVIKGPGIAALHAIATTDTDGSAKLVRLADAGSVAVYIDGELCNEGALTAGQTVRIGSVLLEVGDTCHGLDQLPVQAAPPAQTDAPVVVRGDSKWRVSQQSKTADAEVRS